MWNPFRRKPKPRPEILAIIGRIELTKDGMIVEGTLNPEGAEWLKSKGTIQPLSIMKGDECSKTKSGSRFKRRS